MNNDKKIIGYNPTTGEPIYEAQPKVTGYNPQTGEPIYENTIQQPVQPKIVGYNPQTGEPIYENAVQQPVPAQSVVGYNTQTGEPIYGNAAPYNYNQPKKSEGKVWVKIIIIILSLALIGGLATGLYFYFSENNKDNTEEKDNKKQKTVNDYDDDDDDYDDDDDDDDYDDDDDDYDDDDDDDEDEDGTWTSNNTYVAMGYEFPKVYGYTYEMDQGSLTFYNSNKTFVIGVVKVNFDSITEDLAQVKTLLETNFDGFTYGDPKIEYISGNKCVTIEADYPSSGEKGIMMFSKAGSSSESFFTLYLNSNNTYDHSGIADVFKLFKDAKKK